MARNNSSPVQQFRGTTAQHNTYTGLPGELTVDTDKNVVVVHDGVTAGGVPMARADHRHPDYPIGTASGTVSGTTKLSDAIDSTSGADSGVAATPKAVKAAYDKAVEAQNIGNLPGIDWIGVPRYWRSTNLPPNHCWANGDAVLFTDWPDLKALYDAGGFEGMLLPWDASSGQQAANLGKWRPNALNPTGLYTPALSGQFFRNWVPGRGEEAGIFNQPGLPNITGGWTGDFSSGHYGAFSSYQMSSFGIGNGAYGKMQTSMDASRCSPIYGRAATVMPSSINQPIILYLGRPA